MIKKKITTKKLSWQIILKEKFLTKFNLNKIKFFSIGFVFLLVIVLLVWFNLFFNFNLSSEKYMVFIPKGADTRAISSVLYNKKLIKSKLLFRGYCKLFRFDNQLRAGSFKINANDSIPDITKKLTKESGAAALIRVTIPEGYQLLEIADLLEEKSIISKEQFMVFMENEAWALFKNKFPFIKFAPKNNLEGFIYPDTYFISKSDDPAKILEMSLQLFEEKIVKLWRSAKTIKGSPKSRFDFYKVMIMASIIEKEAADRAEMPLISSVFYNRLKKRMPLAADPTVVYALGRAWKEIVTYRDVAINSPYNTYKNAGFTPTPIASFGVDAFQASLNPAKTNYYFFVANADGRTHSFTETYAEHLKVQRMAARARWRKVRKK
jgi:UPF0755 protein